MSAIDLRTRLDVEPGLIDPSDFVDTVLAESADLHGAEAGRGADRLDLLPLTLDVDGEQLTLTPRTGRVAATHGSEDALVAALDRQAFSDLMADTASTFGLQMTGRAEIRQGTVDDFVAWEPVLRCLLDGRPAYEPGSIAFEDRAGDPLDLHRAFGLDEDPAEISHFLSEAGFLHLEGIFTEPEMAEVSAELDVAVAEAERDDGASWWARTDADGWYAARVLGFNAKSPALRELLQDDRFTRIGTFTDDRFVQRDPDVGDSAEGLLKKVGVVEGISDVSWHKDCAMGGHSRHCCGLVVGLSITGAGPDNGELGAVAGSHRANISPLGIEGLDLPRVPLPTRTGDVTVHCSCTLHMSRPPVSAERRVVYTGFSLAPRAGDGRAERSGAEIRRDRAALNDHVRRQTARGPLRTASFDL
jgi:hypothetical protein